MRGTVLETCLSFLPGVGAQRERRLREEGLLCWHDLLAAPRPAAGWGRAEWDALRAVCEQSRQALERGDALYFTRRLPTREQWRVLAHWHDRLSCFDIETSGLSCDSQVTLVACWHRGAPLSFLAGENLDAFLELLDEVGVLVSFNGAGFDVPRVLDRFHIPALPCAHVDVRWLCHHAGWGGGLKRIEREQGLRRPADLEGVDGAEAVWLWRAWSERGDAAARRLLERYCMADAVMVGLLADRLLARQGIPVAADAAERWGRVEAFLPGPGLAAAVAVPAAAGRAEGGAPVAPLSADAREGSPPGLSRAEKQARLRARWRQVRDGERRN